MKSEDKSKEMHIESGIAVKMRAMKRYGYVYIGSGQMQRMKKWLSIEKTERINSYFFTLDQKLPTIYTEKMTDRPEPVHIQYLKALLSSFRPGDVLVMVSMLDISRDETAVNDIYGFAWGKDIELRFLETPWVNIDFLKRENVSLQAAQAVITEMYVRHRTEETEIASARAYVRSIRGDTRDHNKGKKLETKKSKEKKDIMILRLNIFGGPLNDKEMQKELGIDPHTYSKYKKELKANVEWVKQRQKELSGKE